MVGARPPSPQSNQLLSLTLHRADCLANIHPASRYVLSLGSGLAHYAHFEGKQAQSLP